MLEHIYNICCECLVIIIILMIAHFVFLEPRWKKRQYILLVVNFLILLTGEILIKSEERALLCLLCAGMDIGVTRRKHRIAGFFLVIPIMGICLGILMPLVSLPGVVFGIPEEIQGDMLDIVTLLFLLLFLWRGKKWRRNFELELQYRKLQKWESRLLVFVGIILFCVIMPLIDMTTIKSMGEEATAYVLLSSISALTLNITVIVLVMQGNKRAYYENIAALNESYLKAEIKHFQAYQETQTETRRIRHDMKNHMQSMLYLAKEGQYDALRQYLESLSFSVEHIDKELHCGNALVDAICNEKNQVAAHKGISFQIEGRMPETAKIEPVDICTIFANALDNAIEAAEQVDMEERWMKLEISSQGEILFLRFTNPIVDIRMEDEADCNKKTSKSDKLNHGFGLQNIRISVEKYQGSMNTEILEDKKGNLFALEIMLLNQ